MASATPATDEEPQYSLPPLPRVSRPTAIDAYLHQLLQAALLPFDMVRGVFHGRSHQILKRARFSEIQEQIVTSLDGAVQGQTDHPLLTQSVTLASLVNNLPSAFGPSMPEKISFKEMVDMRASPGTSLWIRPELKGRKALYLALGLRPHYTGSGSVYDLFQYVGVSMPGLTLRIPIHLRGLVYLSNHQFITSHEWKKMVNQLDGDEEKAACQIREDNLLKNAGVQRWHALVNVKGDAILHRSLALDQLEDEVWNLTFKSVMIWDDAVPRFIMPVAETAIALRLKSFVTKLPLTAAQSLAAIRKRLPLDEDSEGDEDDISTIRIGTVFGGNVQIPVKEHRWFVREAWDERKCFFCDEDYTHEARKKEKKADENWYSVDGRPELRDAAIKRLPPGSTEDEIDEALDNQWSCFSCQHSLYNGYEPRTPAERADQYDQHEFKQEQRPIVSVVACDHCSTTLLPISQRMKAYWIHDLMNPMTDILGMVLCYNCGSYYRQKNVFRDLTKLTGAIHPLDVDYVPVAERCLECRLGNVRNCSGRKPHCESHQIGGSHRGNKLGECTWPSDDNYLAKLSQLSTEQKALLMKQEMREKEQLAEPRSAADIDPETTDPTLRKFLTLIDPTIQKETARAPRLDRKIPKAIATATDMTLPPGQASTASQSSSYPRMQKQNSSFADSTPKLCSDDEGRAYVQHQQPLKETDSSATKRLPPLVAPIASTKSTEKRTYNRTKKQQTERKTKKQTKRQLGIQLENAGNLVSTNMGSEVHRLKRHRSEEDEDADDYMDVDIRGDAEGIDKENIVPAQSDAIDVGARRSSRLRAKSPQRIGEKFGWILGWTS